MFKKVSVILVFIATLFVALLAAYQIQNSNDIAPKDSDASNNKVNLPVEGDGLLSMPPQHIIKNKTGNVEFGVARKFGGGGVYYKDKRISDNTPANGNIIDYYQGGALLSHAIWTYPRTNSERTLCYIGQQKVTKVPEYQDTQLPCTPENKDSNDLCYCQETLPNNNPTQGGTTSAGWFGNLNSRTNDSSVVLEDNKFKIDSRLVNFNFAYDKNQKGADPRGWNFTQSNKSEWQTDMWFDQEIYFHDQLEDVLVLDTKVIYCKDMDTDCKNKPIIFADNQISSLFALGVGAKDTYGRSDYYGPYSRMAYKNSTGTVILDQSNFINGIVSDYSENWVALLHGDKQNGQDIGVGVALDNYVPIPPGAESKNKLGFHTLKYPLVSMIQPELNKFENSGVFRIGLGDRLDKNLSGNYDKSLLKIFESDTAGSRVNTDLIMYRIEPGGWYRYKAFLTTGNLDQIRFNLLRAQALEDEANPTPTPTPTPTSIGSQTPTPTPTPKVSPSTTPKTSGVPTVVPSENQQMKPEDIDKDGNITIKDFKLFIEDYSEGDPRIDFNENNVYQKDIGDFIEFSKEYIIENQSN